MWTNINKYVEHPFVLEKPALECEVQVPANLIVYGGAALWDSSVYVLSGAVGGWLRDLAAPRLPSTECAPCPSCSPVTRCAECPPCNLQCPQPAVCPEPPGILGLVSLGFTFGAVLVGVVVWGLLQRPGRAETPGARNTARAGGRAAAVGLGAHCRLFYRRSSIAFGLLVLVCRSVLAGGGGERCLEAASAPQVANTGVSYDLARCAGTAGCDQLRGRRCAPDCYWRSWATGRWIASSPDWDVEVFDLSDHVVVPLNRSSPPDRVAGLLYSFEGLDEDQLERYRAEARPLAALLAPGAAAPLTLGAEWRYVDTAYHKFSETVALDIVQNSPRFVARESTALVHVEDDGGLFWAMAEGLHAKDVEAWKSEKRVGPDGTGASCRTAATACCARR